MSESLGQEAFRVLEDVLVAEIASENKCIQENIDGLKGCQKMLDEVEISIGDETHIYSILEGEIGPDEPVRRCVHSKDTQEGNRISIAKVQVEMHGSTFDLPTSTTNATNEKKDTSLGTTIKFDTDRFQDTRLALKSFKFMMASGVNTMLGAFMSDTSFAPVASINYTGNSYVLNGYEGNSRLDLKQAEDGSIYFFFCLHRATFQGTLHKIGPLDMARDIDELTKNISDAVFHSQVSIGMLRSIGKEVDEEEFIRENYLHDSPDLYFDLESIRIQFTPGLHRAYDLTRKLMLCESKSIDTKSMNSMQMTGSDSLRGKVAVVQGNKQLMDAIRENKHLRGEVQSLSYMKNLLQNAVVRYGDELEIDINLKKQGVRLSDFLLEKGIVEHPSDSDEQRWRVSCVENDILLELNWLDKFSITLGANRHLRGMQTMFDLPHIDENGVIQFKVGDAIVAGKMDFSSVQSMDYSEEVQRQMVHDLMNDNFYERLSKAAFPGVDPGFPEWVKMKVYVIIFPIECVQMFLDI